MSPALAGRFFTTSTTWKVHYRQYSEPHPLSSDMLSTKITEAPTWGRLTMWWPDSHNKNFRKWRQRNGNKPTLELKINCMDLNQWRWCCSDHQWPISRWLSELTVLFLHLAPSLHWYTAETPLQKFLLPWMREGSLFLGTWVHLLPRIADLLNTATFPFTQHLSLSIGQELLSNELSNLRSITEVILENRRVTRKTRMLQTLYN